jgi:hypothetical protein
MHQEGSWARAEQEEQNCGALKISRKATQGELVGKSLACDPRETRQLKNERPLCHFPLPVGRGMGIR